jgi:hypothetical protein
VKVVRAPLAEADFKRSLAALADDREAPSALVAAAAGAAAGLHDTWMAGRPEALNAGVKALLIGVLVGYRLDADRSVDDIEPDAFAAAAARARKRGVKLVVAERCELGPVAELEQSLATALVRRLGRSAHPRAELSFQLLVETGLAIGLLLARARS